MKRAKLLYAVLLVILILFFILYRGRLSLELLIFALIFPIPLWISVIILKRSLKVGLYHSRGPVMKGKVFHWVLQITNSSIFSCANAQVTVEYRNSLSGDPEEITYVVPIAAHDTERVRLIFHTITCGVMYFRVTKLVVFDALRLFHRTIRLNLEDAVVVMPEPAVMLPEEWPPVPQPDSDSSEYSKTQQGDDPSEIFDMHIYREGDLISRIHWKLSSKLDNLMVKEYSLPLSSGCLLMADYRHVSEKPASALRVDTMLSAFFSAAAQLSEQGLGFSVAGYHKEHGFTESERFTTLEDAVHWLRHIVKEPPAVPDERPALLSAEDELLSGSGAYERILLFTPQLDRELTELLISAPNPERITVFFVVAPKDENVPSENAYAFRCIPVLQQKPVHPNVNPVKIPEPDFETEVLERGGAVI